MRKVFSIPNGKITITEERMEVLKFRFADLQNYKISETKLIAFLEFACNLMNTSLSNCLYEIEFIFKENDILLYELIKLVKSLSHLHYIIIDGYYGLFGRRKTLLEISNALNEEYSVIDSYKTEILLALKQKNSFLVSEKIQDLLTEITYLSLIKNGKTKKEIETIDELNFHTFSYNLTTLDEKGIRRIADLLNITEESLLNEKLAKDLKICLNNYSIILSPVKI